jgi:hypothetical protein
MANRMMANRVYTGQKDVKIINAVVAIGAAGAPTLNAAKSWGVASVAHGTAGKYVFTFGVLQNGQLILDTYRELQGVLAHFDTTGAAGASPAAPIVNVYSDLSATFGTSTLGIVCQAVGGVQTDPASGEILLVQFMFSDSSAP